MSARTICTKDNVKVSKLLAVAMGNHLRTILPTSQSINGCKTV